MATYADPHLKIFSLSSNQPLAEKIAASIGVELSQINIARFSDGEIQINIEESVRGDNVYVIQPTSAPVNDSLMELMIMIDALSPMFVWPTSLLPIWPSGKPTFIPEAPMVV